MTTNNPMVKAVFFDIDGTLVNYKTHVICDSTLAALRALRAQGVKLFVATGRPLKGTAFLKDIFDFDGFLALTGSYCADRDGVFFTKKMSMDTRTRFMDYLESHNLAGIMETADRYVYTEINDRVRTVMNRELPPAENCRDLAEDVFQMIAFVDADEQAGLMAQMHDCTAFRWSEGAIDLTLKTGGKRAGITAVLEKYGISRADTMAFGDGGNDCDMLEFVGTGVAMGNAADAAKAAADYVADDVEHDGIFKALKHFKLI